MPVFNFPIREYFLLLRGNFPSRVGKDDLGDVRAGLGLDADGIYLAPALEWVVNTLETQPLGRDFERLPIIRGRDFDLGLEMLVRGKNDRLRLCAVKTEDHHRAFGSFALGLAELRAGRADLIVQCTEALDTGDLRRADIAPGFRAVLGIDPVRHGLAEL